MPTKKTKLKHIARVWIWLIRKGGSAKTTSAVNFAAALTSMGRKVLLIDLDPQANTTSHLGINPSSLESSINTLFTTIGVDPHSILRTASFSISKQPYQFDLLPSQESLDETDLSMQATQVGMFRPIIDALAPEYDDIVIDTRPTRSLLTISALVPSTHAVIPMEAGVFALDALKGSLADIENVRKGLNPGLKFMGILPTRVRETTNLSGNVLGQATKDHDRYLIRYKSPDGPRLLFIRDSIRMGEAPGFGVPGIAYDPTCTASQDYFKLAEVLHAQA